MQIKTLSRLYLALDRKISFSSLLKSPACDPHIEITLRPPIVWKGEDEDEEEVEDEEGRGVGEKEKDENGKDKCCNLFPRLL